MSRKCTQFKWRRTIFWCKDLLISRNVAQCESCETTFRVGTFAVVWTVSAVSTASYEPPPQASPCWEPIRGNGNAPSLVSCTFLKQCSKSSRFNWILLEIWQHYWALRCHAFVFHNTVCWSVQCWSDWSVVSHVKWSLPPVYRKDRATSCRTLDSQPCRSDPHTEPRVITTSTFKLPN